MFDYYNYFNLHLFKDGLSKVYLSVLFRAFALSLMSVFVPIYLLTLGFPLARALSFVMVLFFTIGIISPFSAFVLKHFGFKVSAFISAPLLIFYFLGLYAIGHLHLSFPMIYLFAFAQGLSAAFYWVPLNVLFAIYSSQRERGEQVGRLYVFPGLASLIAPTIGGFIALFFGFPVLFLTAAFFAFLSVIPLFLGKEEMKPKFEFSFKKIFPQRRLKLFLAFIAAGKKGIAAETLWPVFVYLLLKDTLSIGFIATIASIGSLAIAYFIGRVTTHKNRFLLIKVGSILLGLSWFLRTFVENKWEIFGISFLAGIFSILVDIPFDTLWFDKASQEKHLVEFIVFREISLNIGRSALLFIAIFLLNTIAPSFSFAGVSSFFFMFF